MTSGLQHYYKRKSVYIRESKNTRKQTGESLLCIWRTVIVPTVVELRTKTLFQEEKEFVWNERQLSAWLGDFLQFRCCYIGDATLSDNHSSAREEWDIGLYLFISGRIWTLRILPFVCFLCEYSKKWKVLFIMLKVTFCQWNKEIKMTQVEKFFGVVCRYSLPVIVVSLLPTPEH